MRDTNDTSVALYHQTQEFVLNMKLILMKINNGPSHGSILIYFKCFNKKNADVKCEYLQCNLFAYHYDQKEIDNVPKSQNSFKIFQMHVFTQRFFPVDIFNIRFSCIR